MPDLRPALLLALMPLAACGSGAPTDNTAAEAPAAGEYERGPHNGRMLRNGDFALELIVFEDGVPPEFRLYGYRGGKPVAPAEIAATVTLRRLDGEVNRFPFLAEADYLRGRGVVVEPHSFDVEVTAREGGRQHQWKYPSFEGRTTIAAEAARAAGIVIETAGPTTVGETIELIGRVELDPSATTEVGAKYPGPVMAVYRNVGDRVVRGTLLARVESSDSLQTYSVFAPAAGIVTERNTNVGDIAGADPMFVIADPSRTVATFPVFPRDMERVRPGQPVQIRGLEGSRTQGSTIRDFLPLAQVATQATTARAALPNPDGFWRPGMSVRGEVTIEQRSVPLAVKTAGLQAFRDFTVVFAKVGNTYEVRMLDLGIRGPEWTEVKGGIKPGQQYVGEGSFVIKADIEKSGASHDH
ncbi:efflux RND transporter periplasmic adaptor subunit [Sphingomonas sp. 37zxx]|uniref:efflux RND transporter periplasmic adaptor subunit n=1 Tax=Sphingomonas sp. 37zxx TaxID=1550073 RepID=UPI00053BDF9E|nr:efflux RND transporter periplasmic adaptor subunit [Sphingomonas sp. 37zxx]